MSKRVLRDRSTLRRPSDEPPIKQPKMIINRSLTFEELPPQFYHSILEKMTLPAFKKFNLGSKFSARICEEFEMKDGPLDLGEVPVDLYSTIVEKLRFKDLRMFNMGSRLTVEMCEQLREIEAQVDHVYIHEEAEEFRNGGKWYCRRSKNLDQVPDKVRLYAAHLQIEKKELTAIVKHKIHAGSVRFEGATGTDTEFVKEVLMLTRPRNVYFESTTLETLKLEELKNTKGVVFLPWHDFDDTDLVAIDLESFTVGVRAWDTPRMVTSQGILRLLQEWKTGTRRIKEIKILLRGLDRKLIHNEFPGHPQPVSGRMILCKEDGDSDCFLFNDAGSVNIFEQKCKEVGKRYRPI